MVHAASIERAYDLAKRQLKQEAPGNSQGPLHASSDHPPPTALLRTAPSTSARVNSPPTPANHTACARSHAPNFTNARDKWRFTVFSAIPSTTPICADVRPFATPARH